MKYTNLSPRSTRKSRGYKRSLDDDSDRSEHSSDSGLELDHQAEVQLATRGGGKRVTGPHTFEEDANAEFCFPTMPGRGRIVAASVPVPLSAQLAPTSRDGRVALSIVSQPEQQHRARYQTEGSRGAVKDRTGNGFPIVKLTGYHKPSTLQIFVGTDVGRVAPHMFYQACKVSGKNSTPCAERKVEGTVLIEVDLDPSKDMLVTCDCVGILKERNVDVEHRFPEQSARNKKKSTRCRLVFRASIKNPDGSTELLQVCSQPIVCTQPPGIPEICKKSLTSCPATGGTELFILGKNFLKDTKVIFQNSDANPPWEEAVLPDKEFLQQNHLVCVVPPYRSVDITEPVGVKMFVMSSGKSSDPHSLVYLPQNGGHSPHLVSYCIDPDKNAIYCTACPTLGAISVYIAPMDAQPCSSYLSGLASSAYLNGNRMLNDGLSSSLGKERLLWPSTKPEACEDEDTMMPPPPALLPLRHPSRDELKVEIMEEMSQHSMSMDGGDSPEMQGVDLSVKAATMFPHLSFAPASSSYMKTEPAQQFPTLYEHEPQQFMEDVIMRPPPSKVHVRDFSADAAIGDKESAGFPFGARVRSGSFSHSSSLHDSSMSGFETFSRVRSASMSHTFNAKGIGSVAPLNSATIQNNIDSTGVKSSTPHDIQHFLSMPAPPNSRANTMMTTTPLIMCETSTSTRALDAIVNSAAENHMSCKTEPQAFPTAVVSESASVPVTVSEISRRPNEMGDIAGPAPPITGMVPQEMVKMTDHDLISYINPSCFDQV